MIPCQSPNLLPNLRFWWVWTMGGSNRTDGNPAETHHCIGLLNAGRVLKLPWGLISCSHFCWRAFISEPGKWKTLFNKRWTTFSSVSDPACSDADQTPAHNIPFGHKFFEFSQGTPRNVAERFANHSLSSFPNSSFQF